MFDVIIKLFQKQNLQKKLNCCNIVEGVIIYDRRHVFVRHTCTCMRVVTTNRDCLICVIVGLCIVMCRKWMPACYLNEMSAFLIVYVLTSFLCTIHDKVVAAVRMLLATNIQFIRHM